jgi:hypothetical protein
MNIIGFLEIRRPGNVVAFRETGAALLLVLEDAPLKVVCDADIEHTGPATEDVDII